MCSGVSCREGIWQFYDEPRFRPSPITAVLLAGGLLGRRSGAGFYEYENGTKVQTPVDIQPRPKWEPAPVWISSRNPTEAGRVSDLLHACGIEFETGDKPSDNALVIVTPLGRDTTTSAVIDLLDATRVVAVDTLFGLDKGRRRVIMPTPATKEDVLARAEALFGLDGTPVSIIRDSGFLWASEFWPVS
jgi:3-hydroxybutyryl-CoA dehydrogenase